VQTALLLTGADAAPVANAAPVASETTAGAESYAEAHRAAVETGKPMVVLVSTNWCVPCQNMKRRVMPRVRTHKSFSKVAFAVVNPDEDAELAEQLTGGGPIPQLVMYRKTANGWVRQKLVGGQTEEDVEKFISEGLASDDTEKKADAAKPADKPAAGQSTAHRSAPAADDKTTRHG
jgi:thioredoxin-like negative regulator of GroEL